MNTIKSHVKFVFKRLVLSRRDHGKCILVETFGVIGRYVNAYLFRFVSRVFAIYKLVTIYTFLFLLFHTLLNMYDNPGVAGIFFILKCILRLASTELYVNKYMII